MKKTKRSSWSFSSIIIGALFVFSMLCLMLGCGGGSSGTGGDGSTRVVGKVLNTQGAPLTDAQVTIAETGDSVETDESGGFVLRSTLQSSLITFVVTTPRVDTSVTLANLPVAPQEISVVLQLNEPNKTVVIESSSVTPRTDPSENPSGGSGVSGEVSVYFGVYASEQVMAGARLRVQGTAYDLRQNPKIPNFWSATVTANKQRVIRLILASFYRDFSIEIDPSANDLRDITLITQVLPSAAAQEGIPDSIRLLKVESTPDSGDAPRVKLTPKYTGSEPFPEIPEVGHRRPSSPQTSNNYSYRPSVSIGIDTAFRALEGAKIRLLGSQDAPVLLTRSPSDKNTERSWYSGYSYLRPKDESILSIDTVDNRSFRIRVGEIEKGVTSLGIYLSLLPNTGASGNIPPSAGLVIRSVNVTPARFLPPKIEVSPQPGESFRPTPTPVPVAQTFYTLGLNVTWYGQSLGSTQLNFNQPSLAPLTLNEVVGSNANVIFYSGSARIQHGSTAQHLTLQTQYGNFQIYLTDIPTSAYYVSINIQLLPRRYTTARPEKTPSWIEVTGLGVYPERQLLKVNVSPIPPQRR